MCILLTLVTYLGWECVNWQQTAETAAEKNLAKYDGKMVGWIRLGQLKMCDLYVNYLTTTALLCNIIT